ncbi:hypothetical protein [Streptomyces sp. AM 2-1-1]|uniref:hypothetical protein n=1 Tax=Streptomyces sp. AM 2-1-1 TaxID=3028709 RepID=UPI0023B8C208|nr:hypothetical protein [Streptomyces sp. AM 2-1-1]WEH40755.1 hypothetical protein PZB77_15285 [Streptomyces sp. AM 2-1-1]
MAASKTAKAWNAGMTGAPKAGREIKPSGRQCATPNCGAESGSVYRSAGWVVIEVIGSTEPKRLFCSWDCAAYGSALAELRVGGDL